MKSATATVSVPWYFLAAIPILAILAVILMRPHSNSVTRLKDVEFLVLCDVSGSETIEKKRKVTNFLNPIVRQCDGQCDFNFCTFAGKVSEIEKLKPTDPEQIWGLIDNDIINHKGEEGTYWEPVVHEIETCAMKAHKGGKQLIVIVLTNGGFNDVNSLEPSVANLLEVPGLHTLIIGPLTSEPYAPHRSTSCYEKVKDSLSGIGERLIAFPETSDGMQRALEQLDRRVQ